MIHFSKEGTLVTVSPEGVKEFQEILMTSSEVASILAGEKVAQGIELFIRLNSDENYAIQIEEERFNKLSYGYGLDHNAKNMKIAVFRKSNGIVQFIAFIPNEEKPGYGHIIPIIVEDGDILSKEPICDWVAIHWYLNKDLKPIHDEGNRKRTEFGKALDEQLAKLRKENVNDNSKEYRSELFTLANKLVKELEVSRKEAFRLAKEQLSQYSNRKVNEPVVRVFNKKPDDLNIGDFVKLTKETDKNNELSPLASAFKQLAGLLDKLDNVEADIMGELKKIPKREKPINPNPHSVDPLLLLIALLGGLLGDE